MIIFIFNYILLTDTCIRRNTYNKLSIEGQLSEGERWSSWSLLNGTVLKKEGVVGVNLCEVSFEHLAFCVVKNQKVVWWAAGFFLLEQ